ncbi:putative amidoligase enzyme-domain-containing protein [Nemania sp. FL0031]|nr:putative amidoligase enzyme-domain-containing protein [Nemania sp. FL0031]
MSYIQKIDEMIEAADDHEGPLTCGVEIEFLIPSIHVTAQDPDPDIQDRRLCRSTSHDPETAMTQVREALLETLKQQLDGMPFRAMEDDIFHGPHDDVVDYTAWRLGPDATVHKSGDAGPAKEPYQWTDCELTSPVMNPDNCKDQLEKVCRVLKTFRIHLNRSTAVHVHVGRGDEPFSLLTLKRFATLYWLTEKTIIELQHPSRHSNRFCFRLTTFSVLATKCLAVLDYEKLGLDPEGVKMMGDHVPRVGLTNLQDAQLRHIWGCHNIEEIGKLMQGADGEGVDERGSIGFRRFLPAGKTGGNIQTFEWRQMSGSLDAEDISQWVKVCVAFTDFCRLSDKSTFKNLVMKVIDKRENYTGIEFLKDIGANSQVFKNQVDGKMTKGRSWGASVCDGDGGRALFVPK